MAAGHGGGPAPKPAHLRQRTNKKTTAAKLPATANPDAEVPPLPMNRAWHDATIQEWIDIWQSPMATEYTESDSHGLLKLAVLIDDFWTAETPTMRNKALQEIRLQRIDFGLSPVSRGRLHWEIERGEQAKDRSQKRQQKAKTQPETDAPDPRSALGKQGGTFTVIQGGKETDTDQPGVDAATPG